MIKTGKSILIKGLALLAPILFSVILNGQTTYNGPVTEESFQALGFNSSQNEYNIYYSSSALNSAARFDTNTSIHRIVTDDNLNFKRIEQLILPLQLTNQYWQEIINIEEEPNLFILRSGNPNLLGQAAILPWESQLSNYHLCLIKNDSIKLIQTLLPDSAYSSSYLGSEKNGDTLIFHMRYAKNSKDQTTHFGITKYNLNTGVKVFKPEITFLKYINYANPVANGFYTLDPVNKPLYLKNGDWAVFCNTYTDSTASGPSCLIFNENEDTVKADIRMAYYPTIPKSNLWQKGDYLYICISSDSIDYNNPVFRAERLTAVYKYDMVLDSTVDIQYLKTKDHDNNSTYTTGWVIYPSKDNLLVSVLKKSTIQQLYFNEMNLYVLDSNLATVNSISLLDSGSLNLTGGFTGIIKDPKNTDAYIYCGGVIGGSYSNNLDVFWGRIKNNTIGSQESIIISKENIEFSPNPTTKFLRIKLKEFSKPPKYNIYSISGLEVKKGTLDESGIIVTEHLSDGVYSITLNWNNERISSGTFIKK